MYDHLGISSRARAQERERERERGRVNACVHRENVRAREYTRAIEDVRLDSLLFSEREREREFGRERGGEEDETFFFSLLFRPRTKRGRERAKRRRFVSLRLLFASLGDKKEKKKSSLSLSLLHDTRRHTQNIYLLHQPRAFTDTIFSLSLSLSLFSILLSEW